MKKLALALLASATLALPVPAFAGWDINAMNQQVDQTNVIISGICSGTLVGYSKSGKGLYLTAKHCTLDSYEDVKRKEVDPKTGEVKEKTIRITVESYVAQRLFDGNKPVGEIKYKARVKATEPEHDLGLFETVAPLPGAHNNPAVLACSEPNRGDAVYAVGNPEIIFYGAVSKGNVVSTRMTNSDLGITDQEDMLPGLDLNGDDALIVHTATIAPGSSGGALYNDDGKLIGVNVMAYSGMFMSVPLDDVTKFLSDNGVTPPCSTPAAPVAN